MLGYTDLRGSHVDMQRTLPHYKNKRRRKMTLYFLGSLRKISPTTSDVLVPLYLWERPHSRHPTRSAADKKALQRVVSTAQKNCQQAAACSWRHVHIMLPAEICCILEDSSHQTHQLFEFLPSGKHYRSIREKKEKKRLSPKFITTLDSALKSNKLKSVKIQRFHIVLWYHSFLLMFYSYLFVHFVLNCCYLLIQYKSALSF